MPDTSAPRSGSVTITREDIGVLRIRVSDTMAVSARAFSQEERKALVIALASAVSHDIWIVRWISDGTGFGFTALVVTDPE